MTTKLTTCPLCSPQITPINTSNDIVINCPKCGDYKIILETYQDYFSKSDWLAQYKNKIIYFLHKYPSDASPTITGELLRKIINEPFPNIGEQADNLLLYVGRKLSKSEGLQISSSYESAAIGSENNNKFNKVLDGLESKNLLIKGRASQSGSNITLAVDLTFDGWGKFENLSKGHHKGYNAFMAMKFGDEELDKIYVNFFKPAAKQTNFILERLDEKPEAGIIDIRLRNKIKNCRFLIADLTHECNGAYWEAGYAEGLGKPVIYTCKSGVKTHFDTRNSLTIFWDKTNLQKSVDELKNAIRWTIPESKQED